MLEQKRLQFMRPPAILCPGLVVDARRRPWFCWTIPPRNGGDRGRRKRLAQLSPVIRWRQSHKLDYKGNSCILPWSGLEGKRSNAILLIRIITSLGRRVSHGSTPQYQTAAVDPRPAQEH